MDIKQKAVQQAIKMLEAVGARYHIISSTNEEFGAPIKKPVYKRPAILHNFRARLDALKVGESIFIECSKEDKPDYQTSISNYLRILHGAGNSMTSRCEQGIEVLLLASDKDKKPQAEPDSVVPFLQRKN